MASFRALLPAMASAVLLLPGCSGLIPAPDPEAASYATPKPGSRVEVQETLRVGGGARVSLQYGKLKSWRDVYKLEPYCQFHVLRPSERLHEPLQIEPGTFIVERVYRRKDMAALEGVRSAAADAEDFNNSPSQRTMATHLELSSAAQPDVQRLVCARWADPFAHNHVSIRDIRESLGDLVRLVTD